MLPHPDFVAMPRNFWGYVRFISQWRGYTERGTQKVLVPQIDDMVQTLEANDFDIRAVIDKRGAPTRLGKALANYFLYRAEVLNVFVEPRLMDVAEAKKLFEKVRAKWPGADVPTNKQSGEKKGLNYFAGIINTLVKAHIGGQPCAFKPRKLATVVDEHGAILQTSSRWFDGAFPDVINPIAVWEIKEFYYTTTFGSRVADGVYESILDGMELNELRRSDDIHVFHYLMVDSHNTWWNDGRSYLCRLVDMLHMGFADEVLFGKEVVDRLPALAKIWLKEARRRGR
jgi:hypothetical protein